MGYFVGDFIVISSNDDSVGFFHLSLRDVNVNAVVVLAASSLVAGQYRGMTEIEAALVRGGIKVPPSRINACRKTLEEYLGWECTSVEVHRWYCDNKADIPDSEFPPHRSTMGTRRTEANVDVLLLPLDTTQFSWVTNEALSMK